MARVYLDHVLTYALERRDPAWPLPVEHEIARGPMYVGPEEFAWAGGYLGVRLDASDTLIERVVAAKEGYVFRYLIVRSFIADAPANCDLEAFATRLTAFVEAA